MLKGTSFARRFGSAEAAIAVVLTQGKSMVPSSSGDVSLLLRSSVIAGAGDAILLGFGALAVALGAKELAAVVVAASLGKNELCGWANLFMSLSIDEHEDFSRAF